jgi:hypothetical protein
MNASRAVEQPRRGRPWEVASDLDGAAERVARPGRHAVGRRVAERGAVDDGREAAEHRDPQATLNSVAASEEGGRGSCALRRAASTTTSVPRLPAGPTPRPTIAVPSASRARLERSQARRERPAERGAGEAARNRRAGAHTTRERRVEQRPRGSWR